NVRDLFTSRLELRLGDPSDSEVDRRAAANVPENAPGRGITSEKLHFLAAVPRVDGGTSDDDLSAGTADLVKRIAEAWVHESAPALRLLPRMLPAEQLWEVSDRAAAGVPIGLNETYLAPVYLNLDAESHLIIFGDSECGKSNLLRLIARSLVESG